MTTVTDSVKGPVETKSLSIDALMVGRALRLPIHDSKGVLLLAEGSVITQEFKKNLRARNLSEVEVHPDDAELFRAADELFSEQSTYELQLDPKVILELDRIIDSGMLFVTNTGPQVIGSRVSHGTRRYDEKNRNEAVQLHQVAADSISRFSAAAMRGDKVDGHQISAFAAQFLSSLVQDSDCLLSVVAEARSDSSFFDQILQTTSIGMAIGIEMRLDGPNVRRIGMAGLVENWGMLRVPARIRESVHSLSSVEFHEVQKHPIYSLEMLERISSIPTIIPLVAYQMHERQDGKGYPRGRFGNRIHLFSRILQVADAFVGLTALRKFRCPICPYAAIEYLIREAKNGAYDPQVVRALLQVVTLFPIGSVISLSDGSLARVIRRNGDNYAQPIVELQFNSKGEPVDPCDPTSTFALSESDLTVVQVIPNHKRGEVLAVPIRPELPNG